MKIQNKKSTLLSYGKKILTAFMLYVACSMLSPATSAAEKWSGVDESVVEKYAKEQGREAHKPLINTDQGDLLLFVFLLAGTAGGFVAGYYWRILMVEKATSLSKEVLKS